MKPLTIYLPESQLIYKNTSPEVFSRLACVVFLISHLPLMLPPSPRSHSQLSLSDTRYPFSLETNKQKNKLNLKNKISPSLVRLTIYLCKLLLPFKNQNSVDIPLFIDPFDINLGILRWQPSFPTQTLSIISYDFKNHEDAFTF